MFDRHNYIVSKTHGSAIHSLVGMCEVKLPAAAEQVRHKANAGWIIACWTHVLPNSACIMLTLV